METYFVSYELTRSNLEYYRNLFFALENLGARQSHATLWWVKKANTNSAAIFNFLRRHIDEKDILVVIHSGGWKSVRAQTNPNELKKS